MRSGSGREIRRRVAQAEDQHEVELRAGAVDALDEVWTYRSLGVQPRQLVVERVDVVKDVSGVPAEFDKCGVALAADGKALHRYAVDRLDAGRHLVAPCHVVTCAGREDTD